MKPTLLSWVLIGLMCAGAAPSAQAPEAGVPLHLGTLQRDALAADPRTRETQLQEMQSELRSRNIDSERRPSINAVGLIQYQSDVPRAPFDLPTGPVFSPPKDTYDASLRVDQRILDPTIQARLAVERAQLAESQARVRTTLHGLRQEVNDAFFVAALLQQQMGALSATIADLEGRLRELNTRVREGAAVPADAAAVEALLLQRRQDEEELLANRRTALRRLEALTARTISEADVLMLPDLASPVADARQSLGSARARPEYEQFRLTRERLERQGEAVTAGQKPLISAFARGGYGQPGLNFIVSAFEAYGIAGVQVQWKAWDWGSPDRERQALTLQQQILQADEAAFTNSLDRAVQADLGTIDRLQGTLGVDDQIITLRETVERTAASRLQEGVVTSSEYLDRSTELLGARFAQASHRVELAQAGARFLTSLGLEVR